MKIEKRNYGLPCFVFGLFAIGFSGLDIQSEYSQGKIALG